MGFIKLGRLRRPITALKTIGVILSLFTILTLMSEDTKDPENRSETLKTGWELHKKDMQAEHKNATGWNIQDSKVIPHQYGTSGNLDDLIIYNRVPKCGSTSARMVLKAVATMNHLNIHVSKIYAQESLNATGQKHFVTTVSAMPRPLIFIRHVFFVNFTQYQETHPVYINMIRDPLDRLVSDYYFKRYNLQHLFPMPKETRDRTYNECVQGNYSECVEPSPKGFFRVIPYFCGQDPKCFQATEWALSQAKQNVLRYFKVVGLLEKMPEFLQVLEQVFPKHFKGAYYVYKEGGSKLRSLAKTKKKDAITDDTKQIMQEKLKYDYEFYDFIKHRFQRQYYDIFALEFNT